MFSLGQLVTLLGSAVVAKAGMATIGDDFSFDFSVGASLPASRTITNDGGLFVAPHFALLDVPTGGYVTISAPDGSQAVNYTGTHTNFYAEFVQGSSAVVSYTPPADAKEVEGRKAFVIDRYSSGDGISSDLESICGKDDTQAAVCLKSKDAAKYKVAQAVARLFIGGSGLCTGWLFGSEGHLVTNNHCIGDAKTASNVQFEFAAECATCDDPNNTKQLACKGEIVATSSEFLTTDKTLDFTLVKLNLKDGVSLAKYGYLQARASGPVMGDEIYIPQHPGGKPTRIATVLDNGKIGTIESTSIQSCSPDEVGYTLDTEGGSSGSPVLSAKENAVVALHNCGGCMNGAIKIDKVVKKLQDLNLLPKDALSGSPTPSPSATKTPGPTTKPSKTPVTKNPSTSTTSPSSLPTTTRPRKTCKPKSKKPKTTAPFTTDAPSSSPSECGTCQGCYFADVKWCVNADLSQEDCMRADGAVWCGN